MPLTEFDIIKTIFNQQALVREDVVLGIGDDAAVLSVPEGRQLVIAMDTLVAGVHFPLETRADDLAYKALAVNLSDLAAMGAEPAWFTLAVTLPESNETWLRSFTKGLFELANQYNMALVGGDTTQGPLSVTIQVAGYVSHGKAMRRNGAHAGDDIFVTGTLGDAAAGLDCLAVNHKQETHLQLIGRLNRPVPRVETGLMISEWASACIDVSDGLFADLDHILEQSGVGATLYTHQFPISTALKSAFPHTEQQHRFVLTGGDDYELCFTLPPAQREKAMADLSQHACPITRIGQIEAQTGIRLLDERNNPVVLSEAHGFEHFSEKQS